MLKKNVINDTNWLDNYLRPAFKKAFIHLVMMSKEKFLKKSNVFELFGLDFMLDDKLNLWFLECNGSPVFQGTSKEKEIFQTTMLKDAFEIESKLLKSRFNRTSIFIDSLRNKTHLNWTDANEIFESKNKNHLSKHYKIRKNNTFSKIIDFNLKGKKIFSNLFETECFEKNE